MLKFTKIHNKNNVDSGTSLNLQTWTLYKHRKRKQAKRIKVILYLVYLGR